MIGGGSPSGRLRAAFPSAKDKVSMIECIETDRRGSGGGQGGLVNSWDKPPQTSQKVKPHDHA
jgi:hypothetical protein